MNRVAMCCLIFAASARVQAAEPRSVSSPTPPVASAPDETPSPQAVWLTGHSPPLVANWNRRDAGGWGPTYQLRALRAGVPIMPTLGVPWPWHAKRIGKPARALLNYAKANDLPLCLLSPQPEGVMMKRKEFRQLPREKSPNEWRIGDDGNLDSTPRLSPVGAVSAWGKAGEWWVDNAWFRAAQQVYPNPPWVYWLSNNEAALLRPKLREEDLGFVGRYGPGTATAEAASIFGKHWIEKYKTMFDAIRAGLPQWGDELHFVGYGMANYRLGKFDPVYGYGWQAQIWDGSSPPFYMNHWQRERDFQLDSIQSIHSAWVPLTEWQSQQRGHWFREVSIWHGAAQATGRPLFACQRRLL